MKFRIHLLCFLLVIYSLKVVAQSKQAFERAGDKSMEQHDPFSAVNFYNQALAYEETPELSFKIGMAYKSLNEYAIALNWFMHAKIKSDSDEHLSAISNLEAADMLKRLGRYNEAKQLLITKKQLNSIDSLLYDETLNGIIFAEVLSKDSLPISVNHAGDIINSAYSDVAPIPLGDSMIYFSSLRYTVRGKDNKSKLTSKILSSKKSENQFTNPEPLPQNINLSKWNTANPSVSPDGKLLIFSRCEENEENILSCSIYESKSKNGSWQNPVKLNDSINLKGFTSTQPCITTKGADGYVLFYSSNRPDGFGQNDIWISSRSASGIYSSPQNAGNLINTKDDEITPFYNAITDSLYYSSDRKNGLGGYDIICTAFKDGKPIVSVHPPLPLNSGYNDLYYVSNYSAIPNRYIVSNRPPAEKLNKSVCCYDIFYLNDLPNAVETPKVADTIPPLIPASSLTLFNIPADSLPTLPISILQEKLLEILPIRLYFDNDFPDPHTRKTTTSSLYNILAVNYLQKLPEYISAQTITNYQEENQNKIQSFFKDSIDGNFKKLTALTEIISKLLNSGYHLNLKLQGCASPLAESEYNVTLSMRRISSLRNFWLNWNNGMLKEYIKSGKFKLVDDPTGEHLSNPEVSDNLGDKAASVYSVAAALERRIEVIEITLQKP